MYIVMFYDPYVLFIAMKTKTYSNTQVKHFKFVLEQNRTVLA